MKKIKLQKHYKLRPHQKEAVEFMEKGSLVSLFTGCVDRDTEYLTPNGWKKICDYQEGDLVAEWQIQDKPLLNIKKDEITFKSPQEYIEEPCEYLTRIKTNTIDMVVSDYHNVPYITYSGKGVYQSKKWIDLKNTAVISIPRRFILKDDLPSLNLPKAYIKVLIMQSADGYKVETKTKGVKFTINVKREKKKIRVIKLLKRAKIPYRIHKSGEGYIRVMYYPPKEISQKGLSVLWGANKKQLKFIRKEIIFWDGSTSARKNVTTNRFTGNYEDCEFAQYCFSIVSGNYVTMSEDDRPEKGYKTKIYDVRESSRSFSTLYQNESGDRSHLKPTKPYKTLDGKMYCFTTSSGYWLARRNGKIFPTGNSGKTLISFTHFYQKINKGEKWKCLYLTENNLINSVIQDHEKFYGYSDNLTTILQATVAKRHKTYKNFPIDPKLDFLVMNYHTATNDTLEILDMLEAIEEEGYKTFIVLDEVEIARNEDTTFYKTLEALGGVGNKAKGFSATPLKKGLVDLYNIINLLEQKEVIKKSKFYKKYCDIEIRKTATVSHRGRRVGFPLTEVFQEGTKRFTITIPYWFFKNISLKGGLKIVECVSPESVKVSRGEGGISVTLPMHYEGKINFRYEQASFSVYVSQRKKVIGYNNVKKFYSKVSKYVHTIAKSSIKELPTFKTKVHYFKRSKNSKKVLQELYEEDSVPYATESIAELTPIEIVKSNPDVKVKLKDEPNEIITTLIKDSIKLYKKGEIVIVFNSYTTVIHQLEELIYKKSKKIDVRVIVGRMKKVDLEEIKEDASESKPMILLMNEAGIRGLNLQTSRHIKILGSTKSAGDLIQLYGRISRLGTRFKKVYVDWYLVKNSVIEDLYKITQGELAMIEELNPELLEKGIEMGKGVKEIAMTNGGKDYLKQGLKNRKALFTK